MISLRFFPSGSTPNGQITERSLWRDITIRCIIMTHEIAQAVRPIGDTKVPDRSRVDGSMTNKTHWEKIYTTKASDSVSWFQQHPDLSLRFIHGAGIRAGDPIIDVGGGASTLVDDLLADGYTDVTVLDVSGAALAAAQHRLGARAASAHWLEADVTDAGLASDAYALWHDRAVFHFLTERVERTAYVQALLCSVKPSGHVIVATFAEDGPTQCSGLPVVRYSADQLRAELGESFALVRQEREAHRTPFGTVHPFLYCYFRRVGS